MSKRQWMMRRVGLLVVVVTGVGALMTYGIAQTTVVTQAEWAVYVVRALGLDWNLPPIPKSNDYIARLNWGASIDFAATQLLPGSSPTVLKVSEGDLGYIEADGPAAEALYRMAMLRPGDYGFRLKLASGGAMVKVGDAVFDTFQPEPDFRWVDLERVSLDPGEYTMSVLLSEGAKAEAIGVTPPCLIDVEPLNGWEPLEPLNYEDLAVTVAKALELEFELPPMGSPMELKGEEFIRLMEIPLEEGESGSAEPFWLSSGGALLMARIHVVVPEAGFYTVQARYFSARPVRWVVDGCLRAITCPVPGDVSPYWTNIAALSLQAGEHDLDVTLPPGTGVDKVVVQQRQQLSAEYLGVVSDEGFKVGRAEEDVVRRGAVAAAVRLKSLFDRWKASRCKDTVIELERAGALLTASAPPTDPESEYGQSETVGKVVPADIAGGGESPGANPIFPVGGEQPVASPTKPGG